MTDMRAVRREFVDYVRAQLVGPCGGEDELIGDPPNRRYLMGVLFPRKVGFAGYAEEQAETPDDPIASSDAEDDRFSDDPVQASNDFLPSSQGVSFFTDASSITVNVSAAWYRTLIGDDAKQARTSSGATPGAPTEAPDDIDPRRGNPRRLWQRSPLPEESHPFTSSGKETVFNGRAELHVRWRRYRAGSLITVSLVNAHECAESDAVERMWEHMLLQNELRVSLSEGGRILEYPARATMAYDSEEEELRLIHRSAKTYAIGHGCAATWTDDKIVRSVATEVMPSVEVPRVTASGETGLPVLSLRHLANPDVPAEDLCGDLDAFIDGYASWVKDRHVEAEAFPSSLSGAATRILDRLDATVARMRAGVATLRTNPQALSAFRLANDTMLLQMRHSQEDLAGRRRTKSEPVTWPGREALDGSWRPFQLGFFLTTLQGLAEPEHPDRDLVDLIWFPTGGGKTEAYLLVAVFEIFLRRLVHGGDGAGTAVISRYTLSLLTTQQFQRTATTMCAAECVRAEYADRLGSIPISIGLWVGEATTVNRYTDAHSRFDEIRDSEGPEDAFLLERCPWCGTEILPRHYSSADDDYGIRVTDTSFRFFCTREDCRFHERLWVHVVDDDLYDHPPSFLLGTVDKFASLAWEARSGVFFGDGARLPPSLIIQDELHLLTGPLGTTTGLYEVAIEMLCEHRTRPPKVIASTATIRRATEQIQGLFARDLHLFPPSGTHADDSYFAKIDDSRPGRLYIGVMAQGHSSDTATVQIGSALLQAPLGADLHDNARDAYWTPVAYHNSLRELGRTVTMALDDIPARLRSLVVDGQPRRFEVEELSSNTPRSQQADLLARLALPYTEPRHVGLLATTNMLSVGVDVPRLGLMLVNGQPKATAEYIQATSRVGRDQTPGLIFGLFRSTRPRDRSHYENFVPYHSALYRHVEPTSVTPFSPPSRDRALHALLVILFRHKLGLAADDRAGTILQHESEVRHLAETIVDVIERIEPREVSGARKMLNHFIDDWLAKARAALADHKLLYFKTGGKGQHSLLKDFNAKGNAWPTLRSMRNVDRETVIEVRGQGTN